MINFHIITLFPELMTAYCSTSIIGRGIREGRINVACHNPRNHTQGSYRKVDDTSYGGGVGMVLKPEPFFAAFDEIHRSSHSPVLLMTPQGCPFTQELAIKLSREEEITIICGHYEGFDERIRSLATCELSVGDYILTGGELAALVVIDSVGRLLPGVVGKPASTANESFADGLLEGPQYTRPLVFRGMKVPPILLSGDHKKIAKWRREKALERTWLRRPDLLAKVDLTQQDLVFLRGVESNKTKTSAESNQGVDHSKE